MKNLLALILALFCATFATAYSGNPGLRATSIRQMEPALEVRSLQSLQRHLEEDDTCVDDSSFKFKGKKKKTCSWIAKKKDKKIKKLCKKEDVSNACQKTCGTCEDEDGSGDEDEDESEDEDGSGDEDEDESEDEDGSGDQDEDEKEDEELGEEDSSEEKVSLAHEEGKESKKTAKKEVKKHEKKDVKKEESKKEVKKDEPKKEEKKNKCPNFDKEGVCFALGTRARFVEIVILASKS